VIRSTSRFAALVACAALVAAACNQLPTRKGNTVESPANSKIETASPVDVAVLPIVNATGSKKVPSKELREALNAEQPADVVVKEDSALHNAIAAGFKAVASVKEIASFLSIDLPVNLPSGPEYLSQFGTTIGSSIALPRAWHEPEEVATRLLVLPHEWQHVKQYRDGVAAGWWPKAVSHSVLYLAGVVVKSAPSARGEHRAGRTR
jgi:hypothetical protein